MAVLIGGSRQGFFSMGDHGLVNMATGRTIVRMSGRHGAPVGAAFSPDGRRLAAWSWDNVLHVWDQDFVRAIAFSRDGARLASGSDDGTLRLWDAMSGAHLAILSDGNALISSVAFHPDGGRVAAVAGDAVKIWDTRTSQLLLALQPGPKQLSLVAFSPDGRRLLMAAESLAVILDSQSSYDPEAERIVGELFDRLHLAADVLNALRTDASLDLKVRTVALEIAERRGDDPAELNTASWRVVTTPGESSATYARALAYAQAATRLLPLNASYAHTLAVAQCRVGRHQECAAALSSDKGLISLPFVAMAHFRLGHVDTAREALARLRAEMAKPENRDNVEVAALLREAEALIGKGK